MKSINNTFFTSLLISLSSLSMPIEALLMKIFIFIFFAGTRKHGPVKPVDFPREVYLAPISSQAQFEPVYGLNSHTFVQYWDAIPYTYVTAKEKPSPNEIYCLTFSFSLIGGVWGAGCETAKVELTKNSATFHTFFKFFDHLLTTSDVSIPNSYWVSEHYIMGRAVAPRPGPKWLQMGLNQNLHKKNLSVGF